MFRFSIRDALLATPLVAVGFAWVCERGRFEATQEQVEKLQAELQEQDAQFQLRETALKLKLAPTRKVRTCGLGIMDCGDCCDPSLPFSSQ